jgi:hypothetical protein
MTTITMHTSQLYVEDRQDCPEGHVRLSCRTREPFRATQVRLLTGGEQYEQPTEIGVFPGATGTHWSDQPNGRSGWYYLVGPVPESALPEDMRADIMQMDDDARLMQQ